jgi:hypothetical protein
MIVHANVRMEIDADDLTQWFEDIDDTIASHLRREIEKALLASEAFRDLKRTIYNACLETLREELAKEFVEKIKGKS